MVGDAPVDDTEPGQSGLVRLEISDLTARRDDGVNTVRGLSLAVRSGQIYGLAGVGGNGQTELAEVLMGVRAPETGACRARRLRHHGAPPKARARSASAMCRRTAPPTASPKNSRSATTYASTRLGSGAFGTMAWVSRRTIGARTTAALEDFEIQGATVDTSVRLLSGGNAQKLVLARELYGEPAVIVAHSPTHGLDVRAARRFTTICVRRGISAPPCS